MAMCYAEPAAISPGACKDQFKHFSAIAPGPTALLQGSLWRPGWELQRLRRDKERTKETRNVKRCATE